MVSTPLLDSLLRTRIRVFAARALGDVVVRALGNFVACVRSSTTRILVSSALACAVFLVASSARATPRDLPFTYPYQTLAKGELEIEQYADVSNVRAHAPDGSLAWVVPPAFQTEFEYGITNHFELALYVVYAPGIGGGYTDVPQLGDTGIRQRVRYRIAEEGDLPVDIALYGEVSELSDNVELEGKIILAKRFGDLTLRANLVGSRIVTYQGPGGWEISPSAGATYQVTPTFHPGFEYWNHTEFPDREEQGGRSFDEGPQHYLGPIMMFNFGKLWWSTGVYARLSDVHHSLDAGESFGRVWARTIVGLSL
jgi:hypothetical protein